MLIRLANLETAVIVLVSVVALFLFPAPSGSFVSTHGPMTTVRSRCELAFLCISAVLAVFRRLLQVQLSAIGFAARPNVSSPPGMELAALSVLRI